MENRYRRTPKNYDGSQNTTHSLQQLLPQVLQNINRVYQNRPDLVLAAWPQIIGEPLAQMTQAISFIEGTLTIKVNNSTLYSLLNQYEKLNLLRVLKDKFPETMIKTIHFRLG